MSIALTPGQDQQKSWRLAFIILSVLIVIAMPFLSRDYGQTGDEWLQIIYGEHIWNYFMNGDPRALNYDDMSLQFKKQELYGGLFDFSMDVVHRWFPSIPLLIIRHFFNALMGAVMMVFTGLLAKRLTGKWQVAVVSLLFIIFSPRIFGESMNNPKDIPFACGFIIGIYYLVAMLQDFPNKGWKNAIGLALGFGIAFGVRAAGGILMLAYFALFTGLYYILDKQKRADLFAEKNKLAKKLILFLVVGVVLGYILGISMWPWGLQDPIGHPLESLQGMTNRETVLRVLFEGVYKLNNIMPWYYEFKWLFISNPLIILAGFILFIALIKRMIGQYGMFAAVLVVFGAFFPILYMIYKHSSVYDTWRHIFFVYPFWVIGAALGWDLVAGFIKDEKKKWIPTAVAIVGLLPAMVWTVRSHPNQYVYFNELVGGAKGAYGYYDLDYYQNSGKQAAEWMIKNLKPEPGKRLMVRSNLAGYERYFLNDTTRFAYDYGRYTERHHLNWDYYVAYPRYISAELMQEHNWKLANVVHTVEIDGVPLCVVVKRTSNAGIEANEALTKKDFATAAQKYAEYVAADNTDEYAYVNYAIALASIGQADAAIDAMNKAIKLESGKAEFYDMLAQLYQMKGDMQGAQRAVSMKNELLMREQEAMGE